MATAELLARLNARVNSLEGMPPGGGPALTEHDIATALGMSKLPEGARYLVRLKWAGQTEYISDVSACLYRHASDIIDFDSYIRRKSHRPCLIRDMSKMAIVEYCQAGICKGCNGLKDVPTEAGKYIKCPVCGGAGIRPFRRLELVMDYLKISHATFYRGWDDLYRDMLDILGRWDSVAVSAVRHHKG